ncbi:MAG: class IV adenylate cyclase [Acidobacteriota bacterium]
MGKEIEVKIKIEDPGDFSRQLQSLNPEVLTDRHFEDNHLLDYSDRGLRSRHCMIRVRQAGQRSVLTFKGPPEDSEIFKIREEIETELADGAKTIRILERLGLSVWFRYQKYRSEYTLNDVIVAVDETPIGNYIELEGETSCIYDLADQLKIEASRFVKDSYYILYLNACRLKGISPKNMVF